MSTKINIVLILLISLIFGIFNFKVFFIGNKPTEIQGFISISFVALWLLYGIMMSYKKPKYFLKFITFYWSIGLILTLISLYFQWFALTLPLSCIFLTPLYGLRYFFYDNNGNFFFIAIFITYLSGVFGYFLGKKVRNKLTL